MLACPRVSAAPAWTWQRACSPARVAAPRPGPAPSRIGPLSTEPARGLGPAPRPRSCGEQRLRCWQPPCPSSSRGQGWPAPTARPRAGLRPSSWPRRCCRPAMATFACGPTGTRWAGRWAQAQALIRHVPALTRCGAVGGRQPAGAAVHGAALHHHGPARAHGGGEQRPARAARCTSRTALTACPAGPRPGPRRMPDVRCAHAASQECAATAPGSLSAACTPCVRSRPAGVVQHLQQVLDAELAAAPQRSWGL